MSPIAGLFTGIVFPSSAAHQSPPIKLASIIKPLKLLMFSLSKICTECVGDRFHPGSKPPEKNLDGGWHPAKSEAPAQFPHAHACPCPSTLSGRCLFSHHRKPAIPVPLRRRPLSRQTTG